MKDRSVKIRGYSATIASLVFTLSAAGLQTSLTGVQAAEDDLVVNGGFEAGEHAWAVVSPGCARHGPTSVWSSTGVISYHLAAMKDNAR